MESPATEHGVIADGVIADGVIADGTIAPRILAVVDGDPFSPMTWSGASRGLLTALRRRGALIGAVNARPRTLTLLERAGSVSHGRLLWHQRFWGNSSRVAPFVRATTSAVGARGARRIDAHPDVLLQLSTWLDLNRRDGPQPLLRCTYQDGNLARFLTRPDLALDRADPWVRRTLAYERQVQQRADLVFTFSDWLRRSMVNELRVVPERVVTVGAGANLRRLPELPVRGLGPPRILFVGRNFDRKGGRDLLAAFRLVREHRPEAELWIAGPRHAVACDPGVRYCGRLRPDDERDAAELDRLYREASVMAMPTLYDAWGNVWLEAMAYGLPCVGTRTCAIPEIIVDGETGYLVAVRDVAALAQRLLSLIDDPAEAQAMGAAGRARVLERYTWDAVAGRMIEAIGERLRREIGHRPAKAA
jgi:glycosyltransferase involved in cell wall biosynthesis